jgi:hypothetical protein
MNEETTEMKRRIIQAVENKGYRRDGDKAFASYGYSEYSLSAEEVICLLYNFAADRLHCQKKSFNEICERIGAAKSNNPPFLLPPTALRYIGNIGDVYFGCIIYQTDIDITAFENRYGSVADVVRAAHDKRIRDMVALEEQRTHSAPRNVAMAKQLISAVCVMWSCLSFALTETVGGFEWKYEIINGGAVLTAPTISKDTQGAVIIPNMLDGYRVVDVGQSAFASCTGLTEVVFGSNITNIGASAFADCSALTNICLNEGLQTIKSMAFANCYHLDELSFPVSLAEIDVRAFRATYNTSAYRPKNAFFKGDAPKVINPDGRGLFWKGYDNHVTVWFVEGRDGWGDETGFFTTGNVYWEGAPLARGASRVWQYANGVVVSNKCIIGKAGVDITMKRLQVNYYSGIGITTNHVSNDIYYTIDGSDPIENGIKYEGAVHVSSPTTVKAIASVYNQRVVECCLYAYGQTANPGISSSQGNAFYSRGNNVSIVCETEGAEIRYTLDGREPTVQSFLYTGPFMIDDTTMIKVKAFKEDWFESETATATFTREWYTVATPVVEPNGVTFGNVSQEISISCETEGAKILYTTDGSDPVSNGREYTKPFTVYSSCRVRAVAVKYDWKNSAEATAIFTRGESLSEAANFYGYTMDTDEVVPWVVDGEVSRGGVSSVRSGAIGNNGTTWLQTSIKKAGTVSFWWKAACEDADEEEGEDGYYDYGAFLVDDVIVARIAGHDGEWHYVSHEITSGGKHTLKWEYRKDGATSYAPDCVWVDQVQWIPADGSGYTLTTPEPVPYSWLDAYRLGVGTDYETAGNAASGKMQGGRLLQVWQDYVAGTDPTNLASRFTAKIEMVDGAPVVKWEPDLNTNGVIRAYKVYGKETLEGGGEWQYPTNSLHRFFKVTVEMP